jgi:hypothetical protein
MASQPHQACALPEGLRPYLLRNNAMGGSVMVPLVPVDQLPFQLQGIPRQLTHRQISDEGWKLYAETNEAPSSLSIQASTTTFPTRPSPEVKPRYLAPDHHVRHDPQAPHAESTTRSTRWAHQPSSAMPEVPQSAPTVPTSWPDTFASIYPKDAARLGYRTPFPSGIEPDPSKKEYCTHWIKTGECDWTVIGCKYKHEMPSLEKLRELGFTRGVPKWWKEKTAIVARAPTWMQRRVAGNENGEGEGSNRDMVAPRVFPDPATFRSREGERDLLGEQPRGILKRENVSEQSRLTPPPAPVQAPVRRASQMSDLLIDLEDSPAPPPSPQLSSSSAASASSSETRVPSSRTSASPPPSPVIECKKSVLIYRRPATPVVNCETGPKAAPENSVDKDLGVRRHSQISWASDTEEESTINKPVKPTQQRSGDATQQRRKRAPRGGARRTPGAAPPKHQSGLANSKHAVTPSTNTNDSRINANENRGKNTDSHARNANRRMNGGKGNEVGTPELHAKIEQVRREAHQKDRARKGAVSGPSAVALGKQTVA